ncbi:MAG TPA: SUMF1/EgtB/PvdO family nonheme iron enzyme, partial [Planctomycetota bacterium]|nr:SUMF1/EgtB/PvdO family nonheme iron enzyme [Planctomycetota bacterium]
MKTPSPPGGGLAPVVFPAAVLLALFLGYLGWAAWRAQEASDGPPPPGMAWIPGGTFTMGIADSAFPDATAHRVTVSSFWMDETEVTNAQFEAFVKATGHVTLAEKRLDPAKYPQVPAEALEPCSTCFVPPATDVALDNELAWWRLVKG